MNLSPDQILFIKNQKLAESMFFDARGKPVKHVKPEMELLEKPFAFNTSPCGNGGHQLRTRAGHCIQCDTSKISYMLRFLKSAYIYIARSEKLKLYKLGSTVNVESRASTLNSVHYGGANDWAIKVYRNVEYAGKIEFELHNYLSRYRKTGVFYERGECRELFDCDLDTIKSAFLKFTQ